MTTETFYLARDAYDSDMFHLMIERHQAHQRALQYHVCAIFDEHLLSLTDTDFMAQVRDLKNGERVQVNISLSVEDSDSLALVGGA